MRNIRIRNIADYQIYTEYFDGRKFSIIVTVRDWISGHGHERDRVFFSTPSFSVLIL